MICEARCTWSLLSCASRQSQVVSAICLTLSRLNGSHDNSLTGNRAVCEARRIRSHLLAPWPSGKPPGLSTITRHEGPDSPCTINTATMQPCRIDRPGSPRLLRQGRTSTTLFMVRLCSVAEQIARAHCIASQSHLRRGLALRFFSMVPGDLAQLVFLKPLEDGLCFLVESRRNCGKEFRELGRLHLSITKSQARSADSASRSWAKKIV